MPDAASTTLLIPADHPALPGHFPGQPLVPGALLLDVLLAGEAPADICCLQRVRFTAAVQAAVPLQVQWQPRGDDWRFSISQEGVEVCKGNASASAGADPVLAPAPAMALSDAGECYRKLPHAGSMCLLQLVASDGGKQSWGEAEIGADNPLLREGRLSAWCGLEYAAQLLACHGALQQGPMSQARVVMARTLQSHETSLPAGSRLQVAVTIGAQQSDALSAEFVIRDSSGTALCSGELTALFA